MLGGASPNRTSDLSRAVGAVKCYSFGATIWVVLETTFCGSGKDNMALIEEISILPCSFGAVEALDKGTVILQVIRVAEEILVWIALLADNQLDKVKFFPRASRGAMFLLVKGSCPTWWIDRGVVIYIINI